MTTLIIGYVDYMGDEKMSTELWLWAGEIPSRQCAGLRALEEPRGDPFFLSDRLAAFARHPQPLHELRDRRDRADPHHLGSHAGDGEPEEARHRLHPALPQHPFGGDDPYG